MDTADRVSPIALGAYIRWSPIIAGALSAAALATVLHSFAGAVGLAVSSTAPTWRDASVGLMILSGVYLILVAVAAYGLGGYIAGLLREPIGPRPASEVEFRDGIHGLLVWALATLLTVVFVIAAASAGSRMTTPGGTSPSASTAAENTIAYDLDRLLRGPRADTYDQQLRAEAGRILLTSSGHSGVSADDRAYLIRLVGPRAGLPAPEAERRVDTAIANAKENLARARRSGVILAFMAGAAALLGAAAAWLASIAGGQHRDDIPNIDRWNILGRRSRL